MVDEFALDPLKSAQGSATEAAPHARLLRGGQNTGTVLPGAVLEGQIALDDGWLLFVTHDVPFEEVLDIIRLDRSCRVRDIASLSWPYATGSFRNLSIASPDTVTFDFFGRRHWSVRLFEKPRLRLPLPGISEPVGVHRRFGFKRHFAVKEFGEAT